MRTAAKHTFFALNLICAGTLIFANPVFASEDAAHELAARFAGDAASQARTEEQLKADEAEMLERAKTEAAARAEEAQRAEAARQAELAWTAEAEKAEKAKQEAAAKAEAVQSAPAPENATTAENAAANGTPSDSNLEADKLAEKLRRVRSNRPEGVMGLGMPPQDEAIPVATAPALEQRAPVLPPAAVRNATSVTILLVMEPGTNGIRRGNKTADPVLCLDRWCYVSTGVDSPAKVMSRGATLGPVNTLGARAGACRKSLTCVFRGMDVAAYFSAGAKAAVLQPIDLRYLHHDRRQPMPLALDSKCSTGKGEIKCARAIKGKGWSAWIIPEEMAVEAGADALVAALSSGRVAAQTGSRAALFDR